MDPRDPAHEYIEQMREEGYSDLDIRDALLEVGWTREQVQRAMAPDEDGPPPPPPPHEAPAEREHREEREGAGTASGTSVWILVLVGCLGVVLIAGAILAAVMFPVFARARAYARQASCRSHLMQISRAHRMYAQDNHDLFATPTDWPMKVYPYSHNPQVYHCPSDARANPPMWRDTPISYAYNDAVAGLGVETIRLPSEVPLTYDGVSAVGGVDDVALRHNDGANCACVDGHVKHVKRDRWKTAWTSPDAPPDPPDQPAPSNTPDG